MCFWKKKNIKQETKIGGYRKEDIQKELDHFERILAGKYGKPSESDVELVKVQIERYSGWLKDFDKLDTNHDGMLEEYERE